MRIQVIASAREAAFAADFRDLLRSVGCEVRDDGPADASIIIGGSAEEAADAMRNRSGPHVVVLRTEHGHRALPAVPQARVVAGSGSIYDVLERVAVPLALEIRTDVFISYARRDAALADGLTAALVERGRRPWLDRRDLEPSDKWLDALRRGIEASDTFLYLATPASVRSKWCSEELAWADEMGKRILPVLVQPLNPEELPETARARQHIEIAAADTASVEQRADAIVEALDRDPRVVRMHRQLLTAALEWKREPAKVLRGGDLRMAEEWLVAAAAVRDVRPTELHTRFIAASRAAQRKRRNAGVAIVTVLFCVIAGLAVWALLNAREARQRAAEAQSRLAEQNAFGSYIDWSTDPSRAFLLAETAVRTAPDDDPLRIAYDAMARNLVRQVPECVTNLESGAVVAAVAPSFDRVFVRATGGKRSFVAPLTGRAGRKTELVDPEPFLHYHQARFSHDGTLVAAIVKPFFENGAPHRVVVWRSTGERLGAIALAPLAGQRPPEVIGFSRDGRRVLVQSGGSNGFYDAYSIELSRLDQPLPAPLYRLPALLLFGQVDIASSTAVVTRGQEVQLVDAFTGAARSEPLRVEEPVRQVMLARGGRSIAVATPSKLRAWRLDGRLLHPVGQAFDLPAEVQLWDVAADASMAVLLNAEASYPAERWSFSDGTRVSIPVKEGIRTPFIMKAGEEYRPLSLIGDRWLLVREPLRNPLEGGNVQQLLLFDRQTLELAAAPFMLSTAYLSLLPPRAGTRFAVVTHDGWVEEWDLLRRQLPAPRALPLEGSLSGALFLDGGKKLITESQMRLGDEYASRLDLWDTATGAHAGRFGEAFHIRTQWCLSTDGTRMATASLTKDGNAVILWDIRTLQPLWTRRTSSPVESIAFRANDARIVLAGITEGRRVRLVELDAGSGEVIWDGGPGVDAAPVHAKLSGDGETLIADYEYDSVALWQVGSRTPLGAHVRFSDAAGMRFELAHDIVLNLRGIRLAGDGRLTGELPGGISVVLRSEGEGTTIVPAGSDTPVLSAFARSEGNLHPVRGSDLLSPSGRWFTLGTNATTVDRASALRVYDLVSGYPVTDWLPHPATSRPREVWPRMLSALSSELDPVKAAMFLEAEGVLATVTTNGVIRRWPVLRPAGEPPFWSRPADLGAAVTGRRLVSARALRRIPQDEYTRLRHRLLGDIAAARGERRATGGRP